MQNSNSTKVAGMNSTSAIAIKVCLLAGIALFPFVSSIAMAAEKDDKQVRAVQRRLQQLQQVQQKLEQENTALKEQLKELEASLSAAQAKISAQKQNVSKLQALNSEQDSQVSACQEAARNELDIKEAQRKQLDQDKTKLEAALLQQKTEVQACQQKNTNLINASLELMKKYEKKALSGVEPLTGLKGVEIENQFQAYRDQAESQYYRPGRSR